MGSKGETLGLRGCSSLQPCYLRDWEMQVHFKIHGQGKKNLNGDGFAIWYTKDRMQQGKPCWREAVPAGRAVGSPLWGMQWPERLCALLWIPLRNCKASVSFLSFLLSVLSPQDPSLEARITSWAWGCLWTPTPTRRSSRR